MLLLVNNVHEKTSQKVDTNKILKAGMGYLLFSHVLQLCPPVTCECNIIVFNESETCNFSCTLLGQKKVTIYLFDHISDVLFFWLFFI